MNNRDRKDIKFVLGNVLDEAHTIDAYLAAIFAVAHASDAPVANHIERLALAAQGRSDLLQRHVTCRQEGFAKK
jgi:hypothetical protein